MRYAETVSRRKHYDQVKKRTAMRLIRADITIA